MLPVKRKAINFAYYNYHFNSMTNINIKFGKRVRELRLEKGLSQEQFSYKANVHRTYIGMIERAEKNISLVNIEKIAKALEINIKDLFDNL